MKRARPSLSIPWALLASVLTLAPAPAVSAAAPEPLRVVAFLDASKSSAELRPQMRFFVEDFAGRLDRSRDRLVVYSMANTLGLIYEGPALRGPQLRDNLAAYVKEPPMARGTSYGSALQRAVVEMGFARSEHRIPVFLLVGDGEDEPGPGCVNMTPELIAGTAPKLGPPALVAFVLANPTDRFTQRYMAIQTALGARANERLVFSTPESEDRHAARRFLLEKLGR